MLFANSISKWQWLDNHVINIFKLFHILIDMANGKYDLNNIEKISNVILSIQFLFLLIYEYKISFFVFWTLFWFKSRFLFICQKCFIVLRLLMTIFDISHFLYIVFCLFGCQRISPGDPYCLLIFNIWTLKSWLELCTCGRGLVYVEC